MKLTCLIPCLLIIAGGNFSKALAAESAAEASFVNTPDVVEESYILQTTDNISDRTETAVDSEKIADRRFSGLRKHFTWGFDLGASIDLSGENMSTFDAETYFGYKGSWIRTAAVGAGIHKAFGNKYTFIPLYALVRTSFRSKPSLFFFELKAGYSFNTLSDSGSFGGAYGSLGLGINLAMTKSFQSHIILSYSYFTLRKATDLSIPYSGNNINSAVLRFGINF